MVKMTFYNNSISLDEFQGDMDLSIFNSLLKYVEIALKSLGINSEGKQIYYQRHKNNTSMLAIKLNEDDDKDEKNYLIFGAEKISVNLCTVYFHADGKISQLGMNVASRLQWVSTFFNNIENQLEENNNEDLEINLCMKIENNKTYNSENKRFIEDNKSYNSKDKSFVKRIKNIFKKK